MTLQQIYYALTVAKVGSLNQAARFLYMTQPSLTSAIKDLEQEIGITIFYRTTKGMLPTEEGSEFLASARQLYQQFELLSDMYTGQKELKKKFGVSTQHYSFAVKAFVETVKQFGSSEYQFSLQETRTNDVIRDVAEYRSEIGILFFSEFNRNYLKKRLAERGLTFFNLIHCKAYVYLWKEHPLAKQEKILMKDLLAYPCLSFEQGEDDSLFFAEEILGEKKYPKKIKTNDRATMLNLMIGLNGYTLCSGIISEELNGSDYVMVPFCEDEENKNSEMTIGYIVRRSGKISDVGEVYLKELRKALAK